MKNTNSVKIAIQHGCKTVKDFAKFVKCHNDALRIIGK